MPNNNKAFNISTLCNLRGISTDSDEAEAMKEWTVLQLLNAIKAERDARKPPPPPPKRTPLSFLGARPRRLERPSMVESERVSMMQEYIVRERESTVINTTHK